MYICIYTKYIHIIMYIIYYMAAAAPRVYLECVSFIKFIWQPHRTAPHTIIVSPRRPLPVDRWRAVRWVSVAVRRRVYNYYYYYYYWTSRAHDVPPPRTPTTKSSAATHYRGRIERLWRNLDETIARPDRTPCDEILLSQYL